MAQLDNVHSVLRLNYETLRRLISFASPSVAKLTVYETLMAHLPMLSAGGYGDGQAATTGRGARSY